MAEKKCVMISSTARDLPEHRKEVMDACLRQGMFPVMMEHLPASDEEAIAASLKMVDEADIYVGIFAHCYGYVPKGHAIAITEMEYKRAVERKIPRCIFVMDKEHPLKIEDVEMGEGATKLEAFKKRLLTDNIVNFFKSPADLRANVINSLSQYREADITQFHYVSDIPAPPEAYIAHPYTLLQTHRLIGRQDELNLLTNWVTKRAEQIYWTRILNIVAIGGMGKSALTWKWFNDIAPQEMKPLAGRMWWSFYESDASFENFVIRTLAYVTQRPHEEVQKISPPEREAQLLAALDREPFLLVLDGLERILIAYARMDAARLNDGQVGSEKKLRKTSDPRVGSFLKKLAQVKNSRILVSSRLYPAELETETGDPIPGSFRHEIGGLTDEDAVELWRAFGISGSRGELLPIFTKFDKHPLLIQALAGEVKNYRHAPGNFTEWRKANPKFEPTKCARVQEAMGHVLEYALHGLDDKARKILETIAAFRMPASYDTLAALFVGKDKPCPYEMDLDAVLTELEDRGLLGWDKRANRYDLHPIVRGVVWSRLRDDTRRGVYTNLHAHFDSLATVDFDGVNSLDDLTPAIELYNTLIGLGHYDDAALLFNKRLSGVMTYRLSATRQQVELLEMLFPEGLDKPPRLTSNKWQVLALQALAMAHNKGAQPEQAARFYQRQIAISQMTDSSVDSILGLEGLADVLRMCGVLRKSEAVARRALIVTRQAGGESYEGRVLHRLGLATRPAGEALYEGRVLYRLGLALAARGITADCKTALNRSLRIFLENQLSNAIAGAYAFLAECVLWFGELTIASSLADHAWEFAQVRHFERDCIRAARLQGAAALGLDDIAKADERLHHALTRARTVNYVEEELAALVPLAKLRRRQKDLKAARELLDDVWEYAERGPYPLEHADAFNALAQIERDAGNNTAAVDAATKAYRLAWCDGEPFAYHWGLVAARKHLKELGAPEPEMPPFDESKYEPMPEVEINPNDEFHVDENELGT